MKIDSSLKAIIVSNSLSILKKEYGKIIDDFDIVIRLNKCVTDGYEKYIGSKTDIWSASSFYLSALPNCEHTKKKVKPKHDKSGRLLPWFYPNNLIDLQAIWYRTPETYINFKKTLPHLFMTSWPSDSKMKNADNYHVLSQTKEFAETFKEFIAKDDTPIKMWGGDNHGGCLKNSKAEMDTGLLTILNSTLFFNNVTIYGFDFFTDENGKTTPWHKLDYYREKELEQDGTHAEDAAWERSTTGKEYFTEFITRDANTERKQIIQTLVNRNQVTILK